MEKSERDSETRSVVPVKVLLDTNFLLTMVRHKIHGFEELDAKLRPELFTLSGVMGEIEALSKKDKKIKNEANVVKQILTNNKVKILESTMGSIDNELVELCGEYVIATNDKVLRQRVQKAGGKTIYIRSLDFIDVSEVLD